MRCPFPGCQESRLFRDLLQRLPQDKAKEGRVDQERQLQHTDHSNASLHYKEEVRQKCQVTWVNEKGAPGLTNIRGKSSLAEVQRNWAARDHIMKAVRIKHFIKETPRTRSPVTICPLSHWPPFCGCEYPTSFLSI